MESLAQDRLLLTVTLLFGPVIGTAGSSLFALCRAQDLPDLTELGNISGAFSQRSPTHTPEFGELNWGEACRMPWEAGRGAFRELASPCIRPPTPLSVPSYLL